ncbi:hypothetical protein CPTPhageEI1_281 [Klebsiella phage EI]|nr:hypothetical protein CPTPhageEI1_281 [Klebsiella phage EI]
MFHHPSFKSLPRQFLPIQKFLNPPVYFAFKTGYSTPTPTKR